MAGYKSSWVKHQENKKRNITETEQHVLGQVEKEQGNRISRYKINAEEWNPSAVRYMFTIATDDGTVNINQDTGRKIMLKHSWQSQMQIPTDKNTIFLNRTNWYHQNFSLLKVKI